jgi:hypothetical protein
VQQQLAIADRGVVLAVAVRVLADVGVDQPSFIAEYTGVSLFELDLAVFGRLNLGAG